MSLTDIASWLPPFCLKAAPARGAAPGELAALEDRVIADLGLLWCDLAYHEHGSPRWPHDTIDVVMPVPQRRLRWSDP